MVRSREKVGEKSGNFVMKIEWQPCSEALHLMKGDINQRLKNSNTSTAKILPINVQVSGYTGLPQSGKIS